MKTNKKCLNPNCNRELRARGLCSSCYASAQKLVNTGRTTWEDLEAKGKCLKLSKGGPVGVYATEWLLS